MRAKRARARALLLEVEDEIAAARAADKRGLQP
jgi:hypothetical protein